MFSIKSWRSRQTYSYARLGSSSPDPNTNMKQTSSVFKSSLFRSLSTYALIVLVSAYFGYLIGSTSSPSSSLSSASVESQNPAHASSTNDVVVGGNGGVEDVFDLESTNTPFVYNSTYGSPPSPSTNRAWKELFPQQAGFFRHPDFAPKRSTFSAYHQLHCLDGIRHGYWALYDVATSPLREEGSENRFDASGLPMMASPSHFRHCVDLLRRSVMCNPDLTVEEKDEKVGGVAGFGTDHVCKKWDDLVEWTSKWETWGQQETDGKGLVGEMGHGGGRKRRV